MRFATHGMKRKERRAFEKLWRQEKSRGLPFNATLTSTYKRNALYCYKGFKAYQPFNTYWAEHGILLHSAFRDGNVNAGLDQLRMLKEAIALLPSDLFGSNAAW